VRRVLGLLLVAACGGDPAVCGNGVPEPGEQCDDGNLADDDACSSVCRAQATIDTVFRWLPLIASQFPGFFESCGGLQIETVEVAVVGPRSVTQQVPCSFGQLNVPSLPAGSYTATLRAFDRAGAALSRGTAIKEFTVAGVTQELRVDWPYEDFTRSYAGDFYFRVFWGGADTCGGASPPVKQQTLSLERGGTAIATMTMTGVPLDGSRPGPCHDARETLNLVATSVPWGPARLLVMGEDADGVARFRGTFDTFVGAGTNPALDFDVPSLAPDAGVAPDAL
jgi:cysteine-rich repeat protein